MSQSSTEVQTNILYNPEAYADILRFYDGICEWEEGSSTPVLHVGWAQNLTFSLNKFDPRTRAKIDVGRDEENDEDEERSENDENDVDVEYRFRSRKDSEHGSEKRSNKMKDVKDPLQTVDDLKKEDYALSSHLTFHAGQRAASRGRKGQRRKNSGTSKDLCPDVTSEKIDTKTNGDEQKIKSTIEELASKIGQQECNLDTAPNPNITALAQQCSLNILNKDYLLGAGEPFSSPVTISETLISEETFTPSPNRTDNKTSSSDRRTDMDELLSTKSNGVANFELTADSRLKSRSPVDVMQSGKQAGDTSQTASLPPSSSSSPVSEMFSALGPVQVELRSEKMKGLKKMFKSSKLNASAIKLQLTAQSQVHVKDSRFLDLCEPTGSARKRARREIV